MPTGSQPGLDQPSDPKAPKKPDQISTFQSLKLRDYRWLWIGSTAMHMAMHMQMISRGWLVLRQTNNSPLALSLVMIAFAAPMAIFSPLGGALADRFSKKKLIMACLLANALMTLLLATLDMLGIVRFWHLLAIGMVNGSLMAVSVPSRQVLISDIVPQHLLMNAISLANSSMNLARILGPALAGVLILYINTWGVFYLIAVCYVLAASSMLPLSRGALKAAVTTGNLFSQVASGFVIAGRDARLRSLIIVLFVPALFGFGVTAMLPVWAKAILAVESDGLGYLMTAMGVGALTGSLFLASHSNIQQRGKALITMTILGGATLLLFSQSNSYATAIPLLFINGLVGAITVSLNMTMIQLYADKTIRGRVLSISTMIFGIAPLGVAPMGALAEKLGTPAVFAIDGLGLIAFALVFSLCDRKFFKIR